MSHGFSHKSGDDPSNGTYSCSEYPYCELGPNCKGIHCYSGRSDESKTVEFLVKYGTLCL